MYHKPFDGIPIVTSPQGPRDLNGDGVIGNNALEMHRGIDLRANTGTPLYSIGSGRVVRAGWLDNMHLSRAEWVKNGPNQGVMIQLDSSKLFSTLMHMSKVVVKVGQYVKAGQLVGYSGSTGASNAPHIHWEVTKSPFRNEIHLSKIGVTAIRWQNVKFDERWQNKFTATIQTKPNIVTDQQKLTTIFQNSRLSWSLTEDEIEQYAIEGRPQGILSHEKDLKKALKEHNNRVQWALNFRLRKEEERLDAIEMAQKMDIMPEIKVFFDSINDELPEMIEDVRELAAESVQIKNGKITKIDWGKASVGLFEFGAVYSGVFAASGAFIISGIEWLNSIGFLLVLTPFVPYIAGFFAVCAILIIVIMGSYKIVKKYAEIKYQK